MAALKSEGRLALGQSLRAALLFFALPAIMTAEDRARYIDLRVRVFRISQAMTQSPDDDEIWREWQHSSKQLEELASRFSHEIAADPLIEEEVQRLLVGKANDDVLEPAESP